eukprot:CAMPEP_0198258442 /NCGR_PEP_ID=MMETSP1447-20131203/7869_1 /TAXON_ID=420782 /ORGANISM="Chaetoceros dichaeta, Strain CCMP1751" /LENGTH=330 /DNA_ID=CAMNT_0043945563 /DNA_START=27 /DNA_END=1019 /DNA_ORIENTATION=-
MVITTQKSTVASPRDEQEANPSEEGKASIEGEWEIVMETKDESCTTRLKQTTYTTECPSPNSRYTIDSTLHASSSSALQPALKQQEIHSNSNAHVSEDEERGRMNCLGNSQPLQHDESGEIDSQQRNEMDAVIKELKHLRKRITNVQQSIQLSGSALRSTSNWEQNCLNCVRNCIGEWRAIVSFHYGSTVDSYSCCNGTVQEDEGNSERHPMHPDSESSKATALEIYSLLQLAMQCGPLAGSNAGYFKRCGGAIALTAHTFLITNVAGNVVQDLRFTEKQHDAIGKWIIAAKKAAEINKPPSKSMLKLQQKGTRTNNSINKKRDKGNSMK